MAMKKIMIGIVAVLCAVLFASAAFAGEKGSEDNYWAPWFKPALSVGYAFDASDPHFTFDTRGITIGGIAKIDLKPPQLSGVYLGGELPINVTCRLKLALEGSWTMSLANDDMHEAFNNGAARRSLDIDNNRNSVTAAFLASYAVLKDLSFIKDVSAVAGIRWDYQTMSFDEPSGVIAIASAPSDTMDLSMHTLAPIFGITSTFKGFQSGIFGGDMKLGFLAGPIVWGHLNYKEKFNTATLRSDDDLSNGYLLKVFGEITALSGKITPSIDGSLSLFAQYTRSKTGGTLDIVDTTGGFGSAGFDFSTASDVVAIGLKAAITF